MLRLTAEPLTKEAFAPYGDVIEMEGSDYFLINNGAAQRFHDLASIETAGESARGIISLLRTTPLQLPLRIRMMERHPLGSQAFLPINDAPFLVVVAPNGEEIQPDQLKAFITNGRQGVNFYMNVWHHPFISLGHDDFVIVDRAGEGNNCEEYYFDESQLIQLDVDLPAK